MINCSLGTRYVACAIAEAPTAKGTLPERVLLTHRQGNSNAAMQQMDLREQAGHISTGSNNPVGIASAMHRLALSPGARRRR